MRSKIITVLAIVGLIGLVAAGLAADKQTPKLKQVAANSSITTGARTQGYLGIGVTSLPQALVSQLPNLLPEGCGVLVAEVTPGSPAEKAGIKSNDILVSYDDQRLYSPDQFVKLVQNDKPERQAKLAVVHDGKPEDLKVPLGQRSSQSEQQHPMSMHWRTERPMTSEEEEARWNSFDSLTLSRTGKDQYKAEIKFRDDKGKLETKDFQGSREQLRKDINAQKDLPTNERDQLLQAISVSRNPWEVAFPFVGYSPDNAILWDFIESTQQSNQ